MDEDEAICKPSDFIRYVAENRNVPVDTIRVPERLLITYQKSTYENGKKLIGGKTVDWWLYGDAQPFCIGRFNAVDIGIARLWIGAAAAVMTLEELIACGAKTMVEIGLSGGLQPSLRPGDLIVVTEAIRDEGTSSHYFPAGVSVGSSAQLRDKMIKLLTDKRVSHSVGPVWSTDAPYRETRGKFRRFKEAGILAVNMETSAIFALAKYRDVHAASAQIVSDILTEEGWLQAFGHEKVKKNANVLLKATLSALSEG